MSDMKSLMEKVRTLISRIVTVETPPDVFRALLEGAGLAAPRGGIFIVRRGLIKGWRSTGYTEEGSRLFREIELSAGTGWPGRLTDPSNPIQVVRTDDDLSVAPEFGQGSSSEAIGFSVRVADKTAAVVVLERYHDEEPWIPDIMGALVEIAGLRLELDLGRRKLARAAQEYDGTETRPTPISTEPLPMEPVGTDDGGPEVQEEPSIAGEKSAAAAVSARTGFTDDVDPALAAAARFARLVATDIRLYNEETVMLGRRNGDLMERLREQIDQGTDTFQRRFPQLGEDGERILHDAFVQVLAGGDDNLFTA